MIHKGLNFAFTEEGIGFGTMKAARNFGKCWSIQQLTESTMWCDTRLFEKSFQKEWDTESSKRKLEYTQRKKKRQKREDIQTLLRASS